MQVAAADVDEAPIRIEAAWRREVCQEIVDHGEAEENEEEDIGELAWADLVKLTRRTPIFARVAHRKQRNVSVKVRRDDG